MVLSESRKEIALIGCGVVSLVVAYYLQKSGFDVTVFEKNNDPRQVRKDTEEVLGASYSGGNARIFSCNEARHHNFGRHCPKTKINTQLRRYFYEGGWMGSSLNALSEADWRWIKNFEAISEDEGATYDSDIISFNKESSPLWRAMMQKIPTTFQEGGLVEGLIRLYQTNENSTKGIQQELNIGSLQGVIELKDLAERNPLLSGAILSGNIALAIEVDGFSVNCQSFCCALITHLESVGVKFKWNEGIVHIHRASDGNVTRISASKEMYTFSNYMISTGVGGQELLRGFLCEGLIAPIYGMWLTLPYNGKTPFHPIKISRAGFASPGAAEGANVVPGKDREKNPVICQFGTWIYGARKYCS